MMNMSKVILVGTASLAVLVTATTLGQHSAFSPAAPSPIYQKRQSYSDYYNEQLRYHHQPQADVRNYTIDTYFYQRPTLSPYLNLTRITVPQNVNNYYRYVLPELERRNQAPEQPGVECASRRPSAASDNSPRESGPLAGDQSVLRSVLQVRHRRAAAQVAAPTDSVAQAISLTRSITTAESNGQQQSAYQECG